MHEPKAFVISPIGKPGSDERRHADWVLDNIIRPACARANPQIEVIRSDEDTVPGPIMAHAIHAIINDRIVFAVLACDRPNVYYELALALAGGRPVIILRHDKERTHFDIQDIRAIEYRFPTEDPSLLEKKVGHVADFVRSVLKTDVHASKVFGDLDALGRGFREYEFKTMFRDIDIPTYSSMFHRAERFIGLQGVSLMHFARLDVNWHSPKHEVVSFFDIVRSKVLFDAVSVHIVMMHPANAALPHLIKFVNRERFSQSMEIIRDEIGLSFKFWSRLKAELDAKAPEREDGKKGTLDVTQLVHGVVNYRLTLTDQEAVLSPYFNIFPFNSQGAALVCASGTTMYDCLRREFYDRVVVNDAAVIARKAQGPLDGYAPPEDESA
jgi:hypothetical protein